MLTKKKSRSFFLLVRVQTPSARFCFPVPLYLFSLTLELMSDFFLVIDHLCPGWFDRLISHKKNHCKKVSNLKPTQMLTLAQQLLSELRHYGRWRMVEVEVPAKKTRVYLDFF